MRRVREGPGRPIDNDVPLAAGRRDAGPKGDPGPLPSHYDEPGEHRPDPSQPFPYQPRYPVTLAGLTGARRSARAASGGVPPDQPSDTTPRLVRLRLALRCTSALVAGLAGCLAFPPVGWWPAAIVSVAALTLLVRDAGKRLAFGLGTLYGLALFVPLLTWIRTIGDDAWLLLSLSQALELGLLALGVRLVTRLRWSPLWQAGVWLLEEYLRGRYPLGGFTWGRWAYSQSAGPLVRLAAWGGAPLVGFAVALSGSLLAAAVLAARREGASGPRRVRVVLAATAGALALVVAPVLIALPTAAQSAGGVPTVLVALVQGNVPRLGLDPGAQRDAVTANHVAATEALAADVAAGRVAKPDVVIWPENATDVDPRTDPQVNGEVAAAVAANDVPMLVGAVLDGPGPTHVSNAGLVWDPLTGPGALYVKRHLVPFGEYIPYRAELGSLVSRFRQIPYDFAPGTTDGTLQLGPAKIGDVICYEVAYDGLVRSSVEAGARLLVVQTNNATYGRNETSQQLAMARLRAVEHGRSVLVAATSGISAVIAPDGRVVASSKIFTQQVLVDRVPLRDTLTVADRLGAGPERVLAAIGLVGCAAGWLVGRRARRRST
ncbi:MAG: apolipoprotein N-acyltransferase [Frankiales bacterium]|nr:apolipoprotein N-acyltransferase [Frankiales bacterium]